MSAFMTQASQPAIPWDGEYPVFGRFSLELHSACNRRCSFCPQSTGRRDGRDVHMDDELFHDVVAQLGAIRVGGEPWSGVLQTFLLDEPLNSAQFVDRVRRMRALIPGATLYCSTNGDALVAKDPDRRIDQLVEAGLSTLNLNVYDEGAEGDARLAAYRDLISRHPALYLDERRGKYSRGHRKGRIRVYLTDMRAPDREVDRLHGRTDEDQVPTSVIDNRCPRPHRHMVVRHDGKVVLCCAIDPTSDVDDHYLGDLRTQTIMEVWNSERAMWFRWRLQEFARRQSPCDRCDHKASYPGVFRRVEPRSAWVKAARKEGLIA